MFNLFVILICLIASCLVCLYGGACTASLRAKILGLRGFDSSIRLMFKGWNSHVHRGFTRSFESTNLSSDNLSREIADR